MNNRRELNDKERIRNLTEALGGHQFTIQRLTAEIERLKAERPLPEDVERKLGRLVLFFADRIERIS